ncbi:unnamed protein product [Polarella glacialis]|uniref:Uncharacterized protein n=1 Tax=Polarella glacialis TaxID=89957 RepID=A0A813KIP0_POLGL|nr:unnamed protein product [Polarella glacialis]
MAALFSFAKHVRQSKVPMVTPYFWVIKVLSTTLVESGADALNEAVSSLSWIFVLFLAIALAVQLVLNRYVPFVYWSMIVLVSVVGTLITDLLTDTIGVPLEATTAAFAVVLSSIFYLWYLFEGTLAIHSITTLRREAWYWLVVLFTFALGTAAGDLIAEKAGLGYWPSIVLCVMTFIYLLTVLLKLPYQVSPVLTFWVVYILTRPLGASMGDFLSQDCLNPDGEGDASDEADAVDEADNATQDNATDAEVDDVVDNETDEMANATDAGIPDGTDISMGSAAAASDQCPAAYFGCNLGPGITSPIFCGLILLCVLFLTVRRVDRVKSQEEKDRKTFPENQPPDVVGHAIQPGFGAKE